MTRRRTRTLLIAAAVLAFALLACVEPPDPPGVENAAATAVHQAGRATRQAEAATVEARVTERAAKTQATNAAVLEPR